MDAKHFFSLFKSSKDLSFCIEKGVYNGEQILPENINLKVEKQLGNIFIITPYNCETEATKGLFSYGKSNQHKCDSFIKMILTEKLVSFFTTEEKASFCFFQNSEIISADKLFVIFENFVWYRKGHAHCFRRERLSMSAPYQEIICPRIIGKESEVFYFEEVRKKMHYKIIYNVGLQKEIFRAQSDKVVSIKAENPFVIAIETTLKDLPIKYIMADGKEALKI